MAARPTCITCGQSPFPLHWCKECGANTCEDCGIVSDTLTECQPCMYRALDNVGALVGFFPHQDTEPPPTHQDAGEANTDPNTDGYGRRFTYGFSGW